MYTNPYANLKDKKQYKANFHTHAGTGAGTCGSHEMADVIDAYKKADYDILTISNHDLFSRTEHFSSDIKLIHGVEYSYSPHMLTIGVEEFFNTSHQEAIDKTVQAGGFVILCHPNWIHKEYWKRSEIDKLTGYTGLEVINQLIYRLSGSGLACDTWDYLLSQGKIVYGFGNDDFHLWRDLARSYNMIFAQSTDYKDVKEAIDNGCFYASTGVHLSDFTFEDNTIYVKACYPIDTYVNKFTYRFYTQNSQLLYETTDVDASYKLTDEKYVRVEVTGENGFMMFLQPVYKTSEFKKP